MRLIMFRRRRWNRCVAFDLSGELCRHRGVQYRCQGRDGAKKFAHVGQLFSGVAAFCVMR
jgi:hypothetical protein